MTRDAVLSALRGAEEYVSGEEISRALGVSRAAVNGAIQSLRAEGYEIRSGTNRGYRLLGVPDVLTRAELGARLSAGRMERVTCLDTVDSTNSLLIRMAREGAPEGSVVLADSQTGGRGRRGRSFESPAGKGIYLSMLLRPESLPAETACITAWAAVAICRAVEAASGAKPGIKWVNDLILGGRKLCGILTEMSAEPETGHIQHIVLGVGLNVRQTREDFPPALREVATSLLEETGGAPRRAVLAAEMIAALDQMRADWPSRRADYLRAYAARCVTVGREVRVISGAGQAQGVAEGVDDDFGLVVRFADGSRRSVTGGEVSVRGISGYV